MRALFAILIVVGICVAGFATFYYPEYNKSKIVVENFAEGNNLVSSGNVKEGMAVVAHAVNIAGGVDKLSEGERNIISDILLKGAKASPLQSGSVLEYSQALGLNLDCPLRLNMYTEVLRNSYNEIVKKKGSAFAMGEALYTAASWAGACEVDNKNLVTFKQMFDIYKKEMGETFQSASWMEKACAGKPVAAGGSVPGTSQMQASADLGEPKKKLSANQILSPLPELLTKAKKLLKLSN